MNDYPDTIFVVHGSGNRGLGKNQFWVYMGVHEAAYLLRMMGGRLTKTNKIGAAATFAYEDVNDGLNAFFQGAKDVNPDIKQTVSFIESWYDPIKGNEATNAQAAAGVDWLFQIADGWEACATKDIMCFGNYGDQNPMAPNNVPNSTLALWDPSIRWIIDEWWAFKTEGKPLNGNLEPRWFTMAEGGADIGEWYKKSDIAVWRPSEGIWYILGSQDGFRGQQWGTSGDIPVPGDFDGDGKMDIAVWRPSEGTWYILGSQDGFRARQWGA